MKKDWSKMKQWEKQVEIRDMIKRSEERVRKILSDYKKEKYETHNR